MKLKIFDLPTDDEGRFDDDGLQTFLLDKEVLSFTEHFFLHQHQPRLLVLLHYKDIPYHKAALQFNKPQKNQRKKDTEERKDWRGQLNPDEAELYDLLVKWRAQRSKEDGMPPYVILTNRLISEIVRTRPSNLTELRKLKGIGKSTSEKYGQEILSCLQSVGKSEGDSIAEIGQSGGVTS